MEFKYALKGVDGNEEFVDGICLARQFVGRGGPEKSAKSCQPCSSDAERIIIHESGVRCPKIAKKANVVAGPPSKVLDPPSKSVAGPPSKVSPSIHLRSPRSLSPCSL
jgi:hypothetical protein